MLAKNKKAPARHKAEDDYLLTTRLFCGYCGAYLCGESGTSRTGKITTTSAYQSKRSGRIATRSLSKRNG